MSVDLKKHLVFHLNVSGEFRSASIINEPTRAQGSTKSWLDIFLKTKDNCFDNTLPIVLRTYVTDYFTTLLQIVWSETENNETYQNKDTYFINKDKLSKVFVKISWAQVYCFLDADAAGCHWICDHHWDALQQCCRKHEVRRRSTGIVPWFTNGILNSINQKNNFFNVPKKSR